MKQTKVISRKILVERIKWERIGLFKITKWTNLSKIQIEDIIRKLLEEINKALINGEEVRLSGSFNLRTTFQKSREAMNLQTKKKIIVPAKRVPKIRFSQELRKRIAEK